jgi:hypothetical protein
VIEEKINKQWVVWEITELLREYGWPLNKEPAYLASFASQLSTRILERDLKEKYSFKESHDPHR